MATRMELRRSAPQHVWLKKAGRLVGSHAVWIVVFALPGVALFWHVWSGHPSTTLTCACGDPAQEVWFMAWPAWAIAHGANVFFSSAVNVPHGANLLSNTSGTLASVVLSPVTWLWGPVTATNVALTLAPAASCWGCWVALRQFVSWKPAAVPAAMVYGYSAAVVTSLIFGHVSVSVLAVPPLLFATLYEILVRRAHSPRRDGVQLAVLVVVQFLLSPEILVRCALFAGVGIVAWAVVGRRHVGAALPHAVPALGLGLGISVVCLAYPGWFGLHGPQSVSGMLFNIAPLSGVALPGFFAAGAYGSPATTYVRFGGYLGHQPPDANFLGWGVGAWIVLSLAVLRRNWMAWFFFFMAAVAAWISLGFFLQVGPNIHQYLHVFMPWHYLAKLPVLEEILPDQFSPFIALFVAFLLALGLDELVRRFRDHARLRPPSVRALTVTATAGLAVLALVPVFVTFDVPLRMESIGVPAWMRLEAPKLASNSVLLTVPFAVSGSTQPMLWQAVDGMHFRLAGGGLKTPNAHGGPVDTGTPGSARRILTDLTVLGGQQPLGTPTEVATMRAALRAWHVTDVVIDGQSRDPEYSSGFFTEVIGSGPAVAHGAWVWHVPTGGPNLPPAIGASLYLCRLNVPADVAAAPLSMADCVLKAAALARRHPVAP
jgi:hypothetical protein